MPYTEQHDAAALDRLAQDVQHALTHDERIRLAFILSRAQGKPRNMIGPAWKTARQEVAQMFSRQPGHVVVSAGVTAVTSMVHTYLGLADSDLCMAARDEAVAQWVHRTLTLEPIDG